jgi:hypothetical protein
MSYRNVYFSDEFNQLFKHNSGQVIYIPATEDELFEMFEGDFYTIAEMQSSNWFPIDSSEYVGMA